MSNSNLLVELPPCSLVDLSVLSGAQLGAKGDLRPIDLPFVIGLFRDAKDDCLLLGDGMLAISERS